ncbi:MAG: hypothetical protein V1826_00020 [bacterium]
MGKENLNSAEGSHKRPVAESFELDPMLPQGVYPEGHQPEATRSIAFEPGTEYWSIPPELLPKGGEEPIIDGQVLDLDGVGPSAAAGTPPGIESGPFKSFVDDINGQQPTR